MSSFNQDAILFKAFSDRHRLAILRLLQSGEKCACELLESLNIKQPALSYHMKILCDSNIVSSRQDGKWTHYRLNQNGFNQVLDLLKEYSACPSC